MTRTIDSHRARRFFCLFLTCSSLHACLPVVDVRESKSAGVRYEQELPTATQQSLRNEINALVPKLLLCEGIPAKDREHPVTRQKSCDTGDGMLWAGLMLLSGYQSTEITTGVRASVTDKGRPFRSPSHLKASDGKDSFSRDMLLGLLSYFVASRDVDLAKRFQEYLKGNNLLLCPVSTDTRCLITGGVQTLYHYSDRYLGLTPTVVESDENGIDEISMLGTSRARTANFETHLAAVRVLLAEKIGIATQSHTETARNLAKRFPNNLFFRYLDRASTDVAVREELAKKVLESMKHWKQAKRDVWMWETDLTNPENTNDSMGWDLVFVASLLLNPMK